MKTQRHRRGWYVVLPALAFALSGCQSPPPEPNRSHGWAYTNSVDWKTDEPAKTITMTVTMSFFGPQANAANVNSIVESIKAAWNGHRYKCWNFVVDIHSSILPEGSDGHEGADHAMPIKLVELGHVDPNDPTVRAFTTTANAQGKLGGNDTTLSTDPADAQHPTFDPADPSIWPIDAVPSTYTHEFGHIAGLEDNYQFGRSDAALVPGTTRDAMFGGSQNADQNNLVSEDMITRVVERSGKVDVSKVKCNMTMDTNPIDLKFGPTSVKGVSIHAWTCDYDIPTNDPKKPHKPMTWHGKLQVANGNYFGLKDGSGSADLTWTADVDPSDEGGLFTIPRGEHLTMTLPVEWSNTGVLSAKPHEVFAFDKVPTSTLTGDGAGMKATFTSGAAECP